MGVSISAGSHRALWRRVTSGAAGVLEAVMSVILLGLGYKKKAPSSGGWRLYERIQ